MDSKAGRGHSSEGHLCVSEAWEPWLGRAGWYMWGGTASNRRTLWRPLGLELALWKGEECIDTGRRQVGMFCRGSDHTCPLTARPGREDPKVCEGLRE